MKNFVILFLLFSPVAHADWDQVADILRGGTNTNTQTSGGVCYYNGTKLTTGSTFQFNGTEVGIGTSPSTASDLTLAAGTSSVAPLKLTAGTNLTIPLNGAIEYDGTNLYLTNGSGRQTIATTGAAIPSLNGVQYYVSTNQTPGSGHVVNFDTKVYDTANAVTTGAGTPTTGWKYTAPNNGYYTLNICLLQTNTTSTDYQLYKNGSELYQIKTSTTASVGGGNEDCTVAPVFYLSSGDYININVDAGGTLIGSAMLTNISIWQVGN